MQPSSLAGQPRRCWRARGVSSPRPRDPARAEALYWGVARCAATSRGYLRQPLARDQALATLRRRRPERREDDFLDLVRRAVYGEPGSPHRALLRFAGCEYADLERAVRTDATSGGGALEALYRQGVYLTVGELKGRRPADPRGHFDQSRSIRWRCANPPDGRAACTRPHERERGAETAVPVDLTSIRDQRSEHLPGSERPRRRGSWERKRSGASPGAR